MKVITLLLASLALAAPAQAQSPNVRPNVVYTWAGQTCPKAAEIRTSFGVDKSNQFIDKVADSAKLTNDERTTLVLMCFMYNQGSQKTAYWNPPIFDSGRP